jgi:hypothetical protein
MTAQEHEVTIEIICTKLPDPAWAGGGTLHLGIQDDNEVLELTPVNRKRLVFHPVFRVRRHADGSANFLGPFAHGPRSERFIYLNWIVLNDGTAIAAPGRIKLHLSHIPWSSIESVVDAGKPIKVTLALSNASGKPVFASIRANTAQWAL